MKNESIDGLNDSNVLYLAILFINFHPRSELSRYGLFYNEQFTWSFLKLRFEHSTRLFVFMIWPETELYCKRINTYCTELWMVQRRKVLSNLWNLEAANPFVRNLPAKTNLKLVSALIICLTLSVGKSERTVKNYPL